MKTESKSRFLFTKSEVNNCFSIIGDLRDGAISLRIPECFFKMLCYSDFSSLLGTKKQLFKFACQYNQLKAVWSSYIVNDAIMQIAHQVIYFIL